MKIIDDLLLTLQNGRIVDIKVGLHWTAVVAEVDGKKQCGLSSTLSLPHDHSHGADVPNAGDLLNLKANELASYANSDIPTLASIGIASLNSLIIKDELPFVKMNAEEVIAKYGENKNVAIIGGFPFVPRIKDIAKNLFVIEQNPDMGDYSPEEAKNILPICDVIAITGMTLVNHTFDRLIELCPKDSIKLMLGPSTPISPVLFDYNIHLISGSIVTDIDNVLTSLTQGANFKQIHKVGVDLVTIKSLDFAL